MRQIISRNAGFKYLCHIAAVLLFLDMMPYFWWWTQSYTYVNYSVNLFLCGIFWLYFSGFNKRNVGLIVLFLSACFFYAFRSPITSLVFSIPLLFLSFASTKFLANVIKSFCTVYCIVVGLALISWSLVLLGIISPIRTIPPLNANDFDYYTVYPLFLITDNAFNIQNSFRFAGPFDEPGMVGTFSALLIFANSFNFRDWKTYVMLISGIASFSLFFYIVIIIVLIPYLLGKKKIGVILLLILSLGALYIGTKDNAIMERLVWRRLEWNSSEQRISGSDRTTYEAERIYKSKRWTREYWIGLDEYERYREIARGSNTYQNVVMHNGMVFLLLYVLFFILYAWYGRRNTSSFIVFFMLFISCIYQRPQILSCAYVFVYTCIARRESLQIENSQ